MAKLRRGSRMAGGPINFLVGANTVLHGGVTLPPDRYAGTVAWKETITRTGVERTGKRYMLELSADEVLRWGGGPVKGKAICRIDVTAEVAAGDIQTL